METVKIDRSFVQRIDEATNPSNQLLKSIRALCSDLAIGVSAEGIEHVNERSWLLQNGYEIGQGFLFSRPMSIAATSDFLTDYDWKQA